jgi:RIO-like serine/threonine protein kinase
MEAMAMNDAEIRDQILAAFYGVWKERGFEVWVTLNELQQTLAIDRIALARNLDLLAQIGLLERQGGMGGRGPYRITAQGVLECERKGLKPEPSLVRKE